MKSSCFAIVAAAIAALAPAASAFDPPKPTQGCLMIVDRDQRPIDICPLEHTDVDVDIAGFIARVTLTQRFTNPSTEAIEAVYVFPMSDKAAVDTMEMTIGNRTIRGVIKEREEARQIYEAARAAGQVASLLDQERPNIFTQSVANIMPGNEILITISYVEYLKYEEGEYEFSFPMVVGPRYVPGTPTSPETRPGLRPGPPSTDQVPDSGKITPPVTPEGTRAGHDISLAVHVNAGVKIQDIRSELHDVDVEQLAPTVARVELEDKATIPNRDFVLRYAVAGKEIGDAVLTHASAKGGFFTLILQPPDRVPEEQITPKEMIFVIDCSGSMSGFPIEKAKKTMKMCIEQMNAYDTFNLISFAGGTGYCFNAPVPNTRENQRKALDYLNALQGGGGTEMMAAIQAALANQNDPERLRVVCFMTDGFIGNDMAILDAIKESADSARVFAFGIGNSVNRFLIEGMGRLGRGASEIVTLETDGDSAAERFQQRINDPILTDITIDFGNLQLYDIFPNPEAMPDLFSATPIVVKGRFPNAAKGVVAVRGMTAKGPWERKLDVNLPADEPEFDVLAPLWAREKIADLMDQDWLGAQQGNPNRDIQGSVTALGLEFGLVTQYTSFVAVEEKVVNENGQPRKVEVPVEMPDGVSYEGIFGKESELDRLAGSSVSNQTAVSGRRMSTAMQSLGYGGGAAAPMAMSAPEHRPAPRQEVQNAPPRVMAEEAPARAPADAVKPEAPAQAPEEGAALTKLDAALQVLAQNPRGGNYESDGIRVTDGATTVVIVLTEITDDNLAKLKALGVDITATAHSSKSVMAKVPVSALLDIAKLDFVTAIRSSET